LSYHIKNMNDSDIHCISMRMTSFRWLVSFIRNYRCCENWCFLIKMVWDQLA